MFLAGFSSPITNGPLFAVIQTTVDPSLQGRVLTTLSSVVTAISPLSMAIAGPLADAVGVQVWYVAGGLICMIMALVNRLLPAVMALEYRSEAAAEGALAGGA
jgi:DHA3 family macrolide efflux protein-like MFS transporter